MTREQIDELAVIEAGNFLLDAWLGRDLIRRWDALDAEIEAAFAALDYVWRPTAEQEEDAETLRDLDDPIEDYAVLGAPGEQPIWVRRTEAYYEAADYYYELAGDR